MSKKNDLNPLEQKTFDAWAWWNYVRRIENGFGRGPAEAARVNYEIALLELNKARREEQKNNEVTIK